MGLRSVDRDPDIRPLGLTIEEKKALVGFLEALTGTYAVAPAPDALP